MINDDVPVFDCVAHPFNFDPSNVPGNVGELFRQHLFALHNVLTPEDEAKRKILGENLLRLSGMNVEETNQRLNGAA